MRLLRDTLLHRFGQPRFTDARLGGDQHGAPFAGFRLVPSAQQQLDLLVAADQRRRARAQRFEPAADFAFGQHLEGMRRSGKSLERLRAEIAQLEQAADVAARRLGDHDAVGRGKRLQARGKVRSFADDRLFLRGAGADQIADHGQSGGNAEPNPKALRQVEMRHGLDDGETGTHRLLGILLMGMRIAEIGEDAVAHIFCDKAAAPRQNVGDAGVVLGDDLTQVLRVEPRRQFGRADQVAEHDGEEAAFRARRFGRLGRGGAGVGGARGRRRRRGRTVLECLDRRQQFAPVADRSNAKSDEIVRRQLGQDIAVDIVIAKGLRILLKPQSLQPVADAVRHYCFASSRNRPSYCRCLRPRDNVAKSRSQACPLHRNTSCTFPEITAGRRRS